MKYYISDVDAFIFTHLVRAGNVFSVPSETPAGARWTEVDADGKPLPKAIRATKSRGVSGAVRGTDVDASSTGGEAEVSGEVTE